MTSTVLILGASGRFGRNCASAFRAAGWTVRHFDRSSCDLMESAKGADVIVNGWNPSYPEWAEQVPVLTANVIAAAKASGATVILPGNVYVYGEDAPETFGPRTPHQAQNPLGKIRIEMERQYCNADIQTILLRAGDYLDTGKTGNWFDQIIAAKAAKGRFSYPGRLDAAHAWAFLPDLARAAVQLAKMRSKLAVFEDIAFPGYTLSGQELGEAVDRAMPNGVKIRRMSWLPLQLLSPFWAMAKGLLEMRYLWNKPHHLDGTRFRQLLPDFAATPLDEALQAALQFQINPDQPMARTVTQQLV